ncbi:MAG: wax ester/triacylglycerol synthase domain-containing protein [Candidatus Nanopelagicales bacterium]
MADQDQTSPDQQAGGPGPTAAGSDVPDIEVSGEVIGPTAGEAGRLASAERTARALRAHAGAAVGRVGSVVESAASAVLPQPDPDAVVPRRLTGFDFATWRSASNDPAMRSPIIGLVVLESSPDWDRLVDRFDRASRIATVMRQKVVEGPTDILNPRLVVDPDFDLSFHLRRFRVADPGTWDQVLDETRRQSLSDFDLARPLWRATVLEGLAGGRAVLIVKLHHAIADGQGAMMIGANTIDLDPRGQALGPMPPAPVPAELDTSGFLTHAVRDAGSVVLRAAKDVADGALPLASRTIRDPVGAVEDLLHVLRSVGKFAAVPSRAMSPVMTGRSINYHFVTFDVPLAELKAVSKEHRMTLNDAFMAGVTGGLRIYHERRGEPVERLRCNVPINLRNPERPAQNAVTIARFEVPVDIVDPVERMKVIHDLLEQWRNEPALYLADPLAEVGSRVMPQDLITTTARRSDFTASNVPGVPVPVWVAGAKVLAMYPMVGTIGAACNVTLLSYNGNAGLGVSMDDVAIPDREEFVGCLGAGFEEVVGHPVGPSDPIG